MKTRLVECVCQGGWIICQGGLKSGSYIVMVDVSNSVSSGLVISKRTSLNTVFFVGEAYSEARILTKVGLAAGCICYTTLSNALSILSPSWKIQEEEDTRLVSFFKQRTWNGRIASYSLCYPPERSQPLHRRSKMGLKSSTILPVGDP